MLENILCSKTRENTSTLAGCWKSTWGFLPALISSPQHCVLLVLG